MKLGYECIPIAAGARLICMKHEPSMTSECSSRAPVSFLASKFNKPVYARRFPLETGFSCVPAALRRQNENQNRLRWSDQMSVVSYRAKLLRQQIDFDRFSVQFGENVQLTC